MLACAQWHGPTGPLRSRGPPASRNATVHCFRPTGPTSTGEQGPPAGRNATIQAAARPRQYNPHVTPRRRPRQAASRLRVLARPTGIHRNRAQSRPPHGRGSSTRGLRLTGERKAGRLASEAVQPARPASQACSKQAASQPRQVNPQVRLTGERRTGHPAAEAVQLAISPHRRSLNRPPRGGDSSTRKLRPTGECKAEL